MGGTNCKLRLKSSSSNSNSLECSVLTRRAKNVPMTSTGKSARAWTFTLNNPTEAEIKHFQQIECNYIVFGKENFDEEGTPSTPHLQGCIRFSRTYRLAGLKKNISDRAHWEPAKDFEKAVNYCMKEDADPFIKDNRKQGQRTDLDLACETVKTSGVFGLARDDPAMFVKYHGGFVKLAAMFQEPRKSKPEVTWIYGDTGTGKTRQVHDNEPSLFVAHSSHQWWDGYRQQDAILIDDMRASWAPFNILLKILDRYQMQVQIKGGFVQLNSPRIYITSQFPPQEIYNREHRSGEDIAQLLRRLGTIKELRTVTGSVVTSIHTSQDLLRIDKETQSDPFASGFNTQASTTIPRLGVSPHSRRPPNMTGFVPITERPWENSQRRTPYLHQRSFDSSGTQFRNSTLFSEPVPLVPPSALGPAPLTRSSTLRSTPARPPTPAPDQVRPLDSTISDISLPNSIHDS